MEREIGEVALKNLLPKPVPLLTLLKTFLTESDFLTEPLHLLKLLIEKKFVHEAIYDLLAVVREKMVTCYHRPF